MKIARELSRQLAELLRREHEVMADFLVALSEFDRKRHWVDLGHTSLFYYLHRELGLSKGPAYYRKSAAELIQRFPEIVGPLREGRLCLTSVAELAKVITPENRAEVIPRFLDLSRMDAQAVVAELQPQPAPALRTVVTVVGSTVGSSIAPHPATLPCEERRVSPATDVEPSIPAGRANSVTHVPESGNGHVAVGSPVNLVDANFPPTPQKASRPEIEPLTADLRRFHVTVSKRFLEKLARARDALSHSMPRASEEEILEAGLDLILAEHAKKQGRVERPQKNLRPTTTDHIPAAVSREVWERDEGRCQWRMADGSVCGSTHQLERDHRLPRGLGGRATTANIRIYCRFHNQLSAREAYGNERMDLFTRNPRKPNGAREPVAPYAATPIANGCAEAEPSRRIGFRN